MVEERHLDTFADDASTSKILGDLEELVAVSQRSSHVVVVNLELLVVEGVEDGLIVIESRLSSRNAAVLVDDDAIAAIIALTRRAESLQAYVSVTGRASKITSSCSRTYHKTKGTGRVLIGRQIGQLDHPLDLDTRMLSLVAHFGRFRLSEHVCEERGVARQSSRVEPVAALVTKNDHDVFILVHDEGVAVCCWLQEGFVVAKVG